MPVPQFAGTERFRVTRLLGSGGMGIVYEAVDAQTGERVALKTLRSPDPQGLYRLKQEFRSLQDLSHPNLVRLGELIEFEGQWFFTMELLEGGSFLEYVTVARPAASAPEPPPMGNEDTLDFKPGTPCFDEARLRDALRQLAAGLDALHAAGKVHRDVKPSNVLVTTQGRVVLVDFGLATQVHAEISVEGQVVGTMAYMAPEQAAGGRPTPAADWYSLGVLLYEALTGRTPYQGTLYQISLRKQAEEAPRAATLAPGISPELDDLTHRLLAFDPAARPTGAQILSLLGGQQSHITSMASQMSDDELFVGREREIEELDRALARAREGTGQTVFLNGESGLGKSALVSRFLRRTRVEHPECVVLHGRCFEREAVPYKAVDGVIDDLSSYLRTLSTADAQPLLPWNAGMLSRLFPVLGRVEAFARAPRSSVRDPHEVRRRAFGALRELFQRLAARAPLVVAIDNVHWADVDSVRLLAELMRPPDAPALLLILARWPEGGGLKPEDLTSNVSQLALGPLSDGESERLAAQLVRRWSPNAHWLSGELAREAQGHPLFVAEMVRYSAATGTGHVRGGLRLEEAILARVKQLPVEASGLLAFLALAEVPLTRKTLAAASQLDAASLRRQLTVLAVANLVRAPGTRDDDLVELYHGRIRQAVHGDLVEEARRVGHERVALALQVTETERPELLVHHLEFSGQRQLAAEAASVAARRADVALAFDQASQLYRTALRLGAYEPETGRELRLLLARALVNAGRGPEAAREFADLAALADIDPTLRTDCLRLAAEQWLMSGYVDEGIATVRAVLQAAGEPYPETPNAALLSVLKTRFRLWLRRGRWEERRETQLVREDLVAYDVLKSAGHGLSVVDTVRGVDLLSRAVLRALQIGEPSRVGQSLASYAVMLAAEGGGQLRTARRYLALAEGISEKLGDRYLRSLVEGMDGIVMYFEGRFRLAASTLTQAIEVAREETTGIVWELNNARLFLMFTLRYQGRFTEMRAFFEEAMQDGARRGDRYVLATTARYASLLALIDGNPKLAEERLQLHAWTPATGEFLLQHWYQLEEVVELAVYEGSTEARQSEIAASFVMLRRSHLLRVQIIRVIASWLRARLLLARPVDRAGQAELVRLRRRLARERIGYADVFARFLDAGLAVRRGRTKEAVVCLRDAGKLAEQNDMMVYAASARRSLGLLLGGATGASLMAAADERMRGLGVADPERMTRLYAPGCQGGE